MKSLINSIWRERKRIFRFLLIGGLSVLLYEAIYLLISRVLWEQGNRTFENYLSIALASVFNYLAHRYYTFESHGETARQFGRYAVVAVLATFMHTFLFWVGHSLLHVYDYLSGIIASGLVAIFTYMAHRIFTFHQPHAPLTKTLSEELDQTVL